MHLQERFISIELLPNTLHNGILKLLRIITQDWRHIIRQQIHKAWDIGARRATSPAHLYWKTLSNRTENQRPTREGRKVVA